MGTHTITISTTIAADADAVYALIVDLPNYDNWLPKSPVYHGITEIYESPITVGTTYIEKSPNGTRYGKVVAMDAPARHVRFRQAMKVWPEFLGLAIDVTVDIKVAHKAAGHGCEVHREVIVTLPWVFGPMSGSILGQFETEISRIMKELKDRYERPRT